MLDFMDYIQLAFAEGTQWNRDNSYSSLTATTQSLLDFTTPERARIHLSSLSTPNFATSYTLGTVGLIEGSVSYLYSNIPFENTPSKSALIPLRKLSPGYRQVQAPIAPPVESWSWDSILDGAKNIGYGQGLSGQKATLLHATLHLPPPTTLNALFLRRISPTMQLSLAVSSTRGPPLSKSAPQATLLTQLSHDTGKYSNEYLFSTDNSLFGWRGLWNFGPDPRTDNEGPRLSLLSAGAEAYYSPVSSLIGMSTGLRFSTLPAATNPKSSATATPISTFPYTLTLTLTPLTGSLSASYSLRASPNLSFSSRFGFNVYSWESEMVAGCELWRRSKKPAGNTTDDGLEWARRKVRAWDPSAFPPVPELSPSDKEDESQESVLKLRVDQSWNVRLLWEGRVKELLLSAGVGLGPGTFSPSYANAQSASGGQSSGAATPGTSYWRGVGVSVSYSS
ncbi:mitochondrial distribution and morphology protein 10 [Aspergillus lucknowensis]|uniref:Mitochondrial distribution and morphology protein 10 n=1 Tax=Aspergillus lucknowensis TaxID=176173 RepID=A0ABR4LP30_9EURO